MRHTVSCEPLVVILGLFSELSVAALAYASQYVVEGLSVAVIGRVCTPFAVIVPSDVCATSVAGFPALLV